MAVKKIPVPFCDQCGLPFLPHFKLKDGTRNPIFDHPERSKRCGKCKRFNWNAGGVDRRRKPKPAQIAAPEPQDPDTPLPVLQPETIVLKDADTPIEMSQVAFPSNPASRARRCPHGLIKCPKCREDKAA